MLALEASIIANIALLRGMRIPELPANLSGHLITAHSTFWGK